eukprot:TRINITY_DN2812_c1_g1_i1.p1 TRINITY_DN2812_c1_g1~~TRINITY_DN2812_c1_g1_i1.p1  ORF type:complete len:626 (+),score=232.18 TRINITY_DN2812_c1_g1_i1:43-1920(+)
MGCSGSKEEVIEEVEETKTEQKQEVEETKTEQKQEVTDTTPQETTPVQEETTPVQQEVDSDSDLEDSDLEDENDEEEEEENSNVEAPEIPDSVLEKTYAEGDATKAQEQMLKMLAENNPELDILTFVFPITEDRENFSFRCVKGLETNTSVDRINIKCDSDSLTDVDKRFTKELLECLSINDHVNHLSLNIPNGQVLAWAAEFRAEPLTKLSVRVGSLSFAEVSAFTNLVDAISTLTSLTIGIGECTKKSIGHLLANLQDNTNLKEVKIVNAFATNRFGYGLYQAFAKNPNLEKLVLNMREGGDYLHVIKALGHICKSGSIKSLILTEFKMTVDEWDQLFRHLRTAEGLEELVIERCDIPAECSKRLGRVLKNMHLKRLDLSGNEINGLALMPMIPKLDEYPLEYLDLSKTNVEANVFVEILEKLKEIENATLKELIVSCQFNDDLGVSIHSYLENTTSLEKISFRNSQISEDDFAKLCEGLSANKTLKEIDLRDCDINDIMCEHLADVVANDNIEKLCLARNSIFDQGVANLHLEKANLKVLELYKNNISAIEPIIEALSEEESHLEVLELNDNDLTEESISPLITFLQANEKIKYVRVTDDWMTEETVEVAMETLGMRLRFWD